MIRLFLALCIALLMAPQLPKDRILTDSVKTGAVETKLTAIEVLQSAQAVVWDVLNFCDREPQACATGKQAALQTVITLRSAAADLFDQSQNAAPGNYKENHQLP